MPSRNDIVDPETAAEMTKIEDVLDKTGIPAASKALEEFLRTIAGPAAEEVGLLLKDKVRMYRYGNQLKMLAKAQKMAQDAGVSPRSVPLRTLLPLLEAASLEDDDDLSTKWASLLVNAATTNSPHTIYPSFPHILTQLSPRDAKLLDAIYDTTCRSGSKPGVFAEVGASRKLIMQNMGMSAEEFDVITDNLIRLGLCSGAAIKLDFVEPKDLMFQIKGKEVILLTQLGHEFVKACQQPPQKVE